MSGLMGGGSAARQSAQFQQMMAIKQVKDARREKQEANEGELRARQKAERGAGSGSSSKRRGRDMLIGNLTNNLKQKLGA